ncbi:STAS domain-containing protein [Streptomyces sp. NPDC028722]|uniref:STAS domain-containing protein n=1 Tax=unclassified Streptomyces TaxID=2593676 RepID=UPI0033CB9AA1
MNSASGRQPGERLRVSSTAADSGTVVTVTVTGEMDHVSACRLTDEVRAAVLSGARRVETDFSRVTFCDCSGLNVLLAARSHCRDLGVCFSVSGPLTPPVARLFLLAGIGAPLLTSQSA